MWATSLIYERFPLFLETQTDCELPDPSAGCLQPQRWVLSSLNQSEVHGGFMQPLISSDCEWLLLNETIYPLQLQAPGAERHNLSEALNSV